jgi:hypothetical protein
MGRRGMHTRYLRKSQKERYQWENQDIGDRIILKLILEEIGWDSVDWIDMAQDRDQWRDLVNTALNLWVP